MIKQLFFFIALTILSCPEPLLSQERESAMTKSQTLLGLSVDYGYILKHSENLREFDDAFPVGVGINWSKMLLSKNAWEFCNCMPRIGAELAYWRWDNPDILGNGLLAMGFIEPYFRTHKKVNLLFRVGLGGAYLTNPYDEQRNPQNLSYSTDLSFALMVGAGLNYRVTDQWNVGLLAKYNHTSNGGLKSPNKGINFPTLSFRVNKSLEPIHFPEYQTIENREAPDKSHRISIVHFSSWNDVGIEDRENFYVFGFAGQYSQWVGNRSAISIGTEVIFDYSRREQIRLDQEDRNFAQASGLIGHEFWLGKVTFSQQLGVYYFNDYRITDDVYQRYGLTYNFSEHVFAGFSLKAHRHVADFFDLRIGYTF